MHKYYLDIALNTDHKMIHAYFDDKNMDVVLKHLSADNFTFVGVTKDAVFDSREKYRKYAESFLGYIGSYKIVDENYFLASESQDSCVVVVQLKHIDTHTQNICELDHFIYFKQLGNGIICNHYHVSRPSRTTQINKTAFFNDNMPDPKLPSEFDAYNKDIIKFMNSNGIAEKSFYYEDKLPYRFVNREYMKLLGYRIHNFVSEDNYSSLANIHVANQSRYLKYLQNQHALKVGEHDFDKRYEYRGSYYVSYRLQSPKLTEEVEVLEWGNFFTQNGRTIVNCFILNMNDIDKISYKEDKEDKFVSVREDCGIHISQSVIIYPRSRTIKVDGSIIEFTQVEIELLLMLVDNMNRAVTAEQIYEMIWNNAELKLTSNVLHTHMSNIRRKIGAYRDKINLVFKRNKGYYLILI